MNHNPKSKFIVAMKKRIPQKITVLLHDNHTPNIIHDGSGNDHDGAKDIVKELRNKHSTGTE